MYVYIYYIQDFCLKMFYIIIGYTLPIRGCRVRKFWSEMKGFWWKTKKPVKKIVIQREDKRNGDNLAMFVTIHLSVLSELSRKMDDDFIVACRSSQESYPRICISFYIHAHTKRLFLYSVFSWTLVFGCKNEFFRKMKGRRKKG